MTLEELIAKQTALVAESKAIPAAAEADNDGEGRDLTEDESKSFDEKVAQIAGLTVRIKVAQATDGMDRGEGRQTPHQTPGGPTITTADGNDETPEARKARLYFPVECRIYSGALRNFRGGVAEGKERPAVERAYRFGRWFAAAFFGHRASLKWAEDYAPEWRLLQGNINTAGGVFVEDEFDADIIDLKEERGVFRRFARISIMGSDTKTRRRRVGGPTATFIGEGEQISESNAQYDSVNLVAKKLAVIMRITNELNDDAIVSIGDLLLGEIAYAFVSKEDDCGFNGTGTSTFGGINGVRNRLLGLSSTRADIAGLIVNTNINLWSEFTLAHFNSVVGILPVFADPMARWFCSKAFFATVMQRLEYAAGGNTGTDIAGRPGMTFLGYPVTLADQMPKVEADDQVACLLGDLALAADYGDRKGTQILFSDSATVGGESVFEYDEIAIRAVERFDINVHDVGNATSTATDKQAGPIVGLLTAAS